ncbi:arginine N-succinyltransferase [Paraglaciecola chathamensis]|uniref:Arginine N-succinyltransferase n=1 Tax=Paraglaciecola chathamensis TaxID=368405 RepID=A0A8H9I8B4_9ALTE|nr:arginine N-succinyltransferase [Paraglaciecola oceanifecundans]GGZ53445.1 arginine N-succinyltransferase [Paraglaciecola oceanifecundans]
MNIIRPIKHSDYAVLHDIAVESGIGFTSLPVNETLLKSKILDSETAFQADISQPGNESYLFVMEDTNTGQVVGTSGIASSVGLDDAFYHYHLSKVVHASRELDIYNTAEILTLCNDYTGVSEICTLFLRESARQGNNGRFLSKVRFLFMMEHKERFAETVIAEMRGISDESGKSPFWQWLEEHFFSMDFPTADYLTGIGQKQFIAELMPKYPIYVSLLSKEAQAVIGKVHDKTKPALRLLESEGFSCRGYVDIFDAGPTVEANLTHIRTAQASRKLAVKINDSLAGKYNEHGSNSETEYFVINTKITDFRAIAASIHIDEANERAIISQADADHLGIQDGEFIRFAPTTFKV